MSFEFRVRQFAAVAPFLRESGASYRPIRSSNTSSVWRAQRGRAARGVTVTADTNGTSIKLHSLSSADDARLALDLAQLCSRSEGVVEIEDVPAGVGDVDADSRVESASLAAWPPAWFEGLNESAFLGIAESLLTDPHTLSLIPTTWRNVIVSSELLLSLCRISGIKSVRFAGSPIERGFRPRGKKLPLIDSPEAVTQFIEYLCWANERSLLPIRTRFLNDDLRPLRDPRQGPSPSESVNELPAIDRLEFSVDEGSVASVTMIPCGDRCLVPRADYAGLRDSSSDSWLVIEFDAFLERAHRNTFWVDQFTAEFQCGEDDWDSLLKSVRQATKTSLEHEHQFEQTARDSWLTANDGQRISAEERRLCEALISFRETGVTTAATKKCDELLLLAPDSAFGWYIRSRINAEAGDDASALKSLESACALSQDDLRIRPGYQAELAERYLQMGRTRDAVALLRRALAASPRESELREAVEEMLSEIR